MGNFLEFLSNNYIYFLIAAGVLFFALIGLLVDMKKKRNGEGSISEDVTPEVPEPVSVPEPPVTVEEPKQEEIVPEPPMPVEEAPVPEINNEVVTESPVLDETPVMNVEAPVEPTPGTQEEIK